MTFTGVVPASKHIAEFSKNRNPLHTPWKGHEVAGLSTRQPGHVVAGGAGGQGGPGWGSRGPGFQPPANTYDWTVLL